jgi:hypothetical protein
VPAHWNSILYYSGIVILVVGFFVGAALALRARREAREGVDITSEAEMLSEFQRARDAGEMDEAEFRRVRDLLISGRSTKEGGNRETKPDSRLEDHPPANPPPEHPTLTEPE